MIRVRIDIKETEYFIEQMKNQGYEAIVVDAAHISFRKDDKVSDIFLENRESDSYIVIYLPEPKHNDQKLADEESWCANPDRMGGQFTDEEIRMSERGGYGW